MGGRKGCDKTAPSEVLNQIARMVDDDPGGSRLRSGQDCDRLDLDELAS
jgi:hypothetical protein